MNVTKNCCMIEEGGEFVHVAYFLVHDLDILSCSSRWVRYWVAMLATKGSARKVFEKKLVYQNI